MNEDQLRAVIREVVARRLAASSGGTATPSSGRASTGAPLTAWKDHASHGLLPVLSGEQSDGPCLVEPSVRCHHCAFCQSFGH
jgi:hypothetical protein